MKRLHGSYGAANLSLKAQKDALRKEMWALRKRLHPLHWTAVVPPGFLQETGDTPAVRGKVVGSYVPQGSEFDPRFVIEGLVDAGWKLSLPRAEDREGLLSFHAVEGPLTPDAFGIPAPLPTAPRLTPDLILVPVLAFDRAGGRLGQGAGCYDRTIAALRATSPVLVVGLAYTGQEVERVPTGEHDQPLDGIVTDKGYLAVVRHSA